MIISFCSSGTALASDSAKVGCRSVFFFSSFLQLIFLIFYLGIECVAQISVYFLCQANSTHMLNLLSALANGVQAHHSYHLMLFQLVAA